MLWSWKNIFVPEYLRAFPGWFFICPHHFQGRWKELGTDNMSRKEAERNERTCPRSRTTSAAREGWISGLLIPRDLAFCNVNEVANQFSSCESPCVQLLWNNKTSVWGYTPTLCVCVGKDPWWLFLAACFSFFKLLSINDGIWGLKCDNIKTFIS